MNVYYSIKDFRPTRRTIVTIGTFDGFHTGHRKITDKLVKEALESDCDSLILTFFPHPKMVIGDNKGVLLLNTLDERIALLKSSGIDHLVIHPFDEVFSNLTPQEFVTEVLINAFNVKKVIIGHDHRFGKDRAAGIDDLIAFGHSADFTVEQLSAKEIDDVSVSSTKIRTALQNGDVTLANKYLGYSYYITGIVSEGKKLGRTIGFPTANIKIEETYKLIPAQGVYIVSSEVDGTLLYGMMNIGTNPTVGGTQMSIEVHFLEFDKDIYHRTLAIRFHHRIRNEQKFSSVDILVSQLISDRAETAKYVSSLSAGK